VPQDPAERLGAPLPPALVQVVLSCLAKDPDDRPRDAATLARQLTELSVAYPWTTGDARAWWEKRGATFAGRPADVRPRATAVSMPIDLDRRR
jgi:hypothetical protein